MKAEKLAVYAGNTGTPTVMIATIGPIAEIVATMEAGPADRIRALRLAKCWNCHDELIAVVQEYLDWQQANFILPSGNYEDPDQMELARNASAILAKAK